MPLNLKLEDREVEQSCLSYRMEEVLNKFPALMERQLVLHKILDSEEGNEDTLDVFNYLQQQISYIEEILSRGKARVISNMNFIKYTKNIVSERERKIQRLKDEFY
ncbi:MAG: hypothetical protein ACI9UO_002417 [Nitrospinales bacterium]